MSAPPVFLGGAPRSGLLLTRALLDAHPALSCGPDLSLPLAVARQWRRITDVQAENHARSFRLDPETVRGLFAETVHRALAPRLAGEGKRRSVVKFSGNLLAWPDLAALFPDSPLICLVRDPRDVAASLLDRSWTSPRTGAPLPYTRDAAEAARFWAAHDAALDGIMATSLRDRVFLLRYEDLVQAPEERWAALLGFLGEPAAPQALAAFGRNLDLVGVEADLPAPRPPLRTERIGRWRRDLSPEQARIVTAICGAGLRAHGYAGQGSTV